MYLIFLPLNANFYTAPDAVENNPFIYLLANYTCTQWVLNLRHPPSCFYKERRCQLSNAFELELIGYSNIWLSLSASFFFFSSINTFIKKVQICLPYNSFCFDVQWSLPRGYYESQQYGCPQLRFAKGNFHIFWIILKVLQFALSCKLGSASDFSVT